MPTLEELVRETFDKYSIRGEVVVLTRAQALTLAREASSQAWDRCLNEIEEYELNTKQAREGNPYRGDKDT